MFKKYALTFLNFLLFLATATLAAAGVIYLVRIAIILVSPYIWLRNLLYYLVMTAIIFLLIFLIGSNMGYRRFKYGEKFTYKLPVICMVLCLLVNFYVALRLYFNVFACGPIDSFVCLCLNLNSVTKSDYLMYPPAMTFAILGFILNGAIYVLAASLGMKAGYNDKMEDEEQHFKLKPVMAEETVVEATTNAENDSTVSDK